MADLLVTGGAGFIGSSFLRYWRARDGDGRLVVLDALTYAGNPDNLAGLADIELVQGDIRDAELVRTLLVDRGLDTIVHFAAETHVDRSIAGPDAFVGTNIVGTYNLLEAAKSAWLDRGSGRPHLFHHVSTDEVYGSLGPDDPPFSETTPYAPNSPYAASKAASDHLVRAWHRTFGLDIKITNSSNNYGPRQFREKLIPLFVTNCLAGSLLPIYGDGQNVRDWLHVDDHVRGIGLVIDGGRVGETYNIGAGEERTNLEVAHAICETVDAAFARDESLARRFPDAPAARGEPSAGLITFVRDRPGHDRRYATDATRIREALGFAPEVDFRGGLAATVDWYMANESRWR